MFGGEAVTINSDYPWVVLVLSQIGKSYTKICSGSAIAPFWVLTAAHCLEKEEEIIPAQAITVNVYWRMFQLSGYPAHSTYRHPLFGSRGWKENNDLGLIRTKEAIGVRPGVLRKALDYPSVSCTILGFGLQGLTSVNRTVPSLAKMTVNLLPEKMCQTLQPPDNRLLCMLAVNGMGPCIGDSGSPIICDDQVAGVCSRGLFSTQDMKCGDYMMAIILYEMVDTKWIADTMSKYSSGAIATVEFSALLACFLWAMYGSS